MNRRLTPTRFANALLALAGTASLALADDPEQEWYLDIYPKSIVRAGVDSHDDLATGSLSYTEKYGRDGTLLWHEDFWLGPNQFYTNLTWLAVDSQDNVIRGGYQELGGGFPPGYLAVKYDPDGNLLWYSLLTTVVGQAFRCELDELDNIYLFGETAGPRFLTAKLDPDGQLLWDRVGHYGEPVDLEVRDGQVVCAGHGGGGVFLSTSYDYDGNTNWENTYQNGLAFKDMTVGPDGQVVLCGWGHDDVTDLFGTVVQYDAQGNEEWVALYNGPYGGIDIFNYAAIDGEGGVIVTGYGISSAGGDAFSTVKLDESGALIWARLYDSGDSYEQAYSVTVGLANSIYVGGMSEVSDGCGLQLAEGHVVKYSAEGDYLWHAHLPCGSEVRQIAFDETGALYARTFYEILRLRERIGDTYCAPAVDNSTGQPGVALATGSRTVAHGQVTLSADQLPPNRFGYFLTSETQGFVQGPGGSQGNLCLGGSIGRFTKQIQTSGSAGRFAIPVDLGSMPTSPAQAVLPGETWNFQAWYRDVNPQQTSNFTDAVSVLFE